MTVHCVITDDQRHRDLRVAQPLRHQSQYLALPRREWTCRRNSGGIGEPVGPRQIVEGGQLGQDLRLQRKMVPGGGPLSRCGKRLRQGEPGVGLVEAQPGGAEPLTFLVRP